MPFYEKLVGVQIKQTQLVALVWRIGIKYNIV